MMLQCKSLLAASTNRILGVGGGAGCVVGRKLYIWIGTLHKEKENH